VRKYNHEDERAIRTEHLVRNWTRSGLLEKPQEDRILPELKVGLRRTNPFFRLILFAFGLLIIGSSVLFVGAVVEARTEVAIAVVCLFGAAVSIGLAEHLIEEYRLYRFGIEEAAAAAGGIFLAVGATFLVSTGHAWTGTEFASLVGLIVGSAAAFAVFVRYGYIYAAIASMFLMSMAPFQTRLPHVTHRFVSAGLLLLVFVVSGLKRRDTRDEVHADDYSIIQAVAWLGIYAYLNVHLSSLGLRWFYARALEGPSYWLTYVLIWILPTVGLFLALRRRDRPLLDVSIVLGLITLATNKPYLGATRQTWDPILLGLLLIGTVVVLRRWLSGGDRNGFTASRILISDKRGISALGTASAALHPIPQMPAETPSTPDLEPGGGRSGGGGASGSF
jgi:hypothetical protein